MSYIIVATFAVVEKYVVWTKRPVITNKCQLMRNFVNGKIVKLKAKW